MFYLRQKLVFTSILLLSVVTHSIGYPSGQEITPACSTLVPLHGVSTQTTPTPYKISFTPSAYTSASQISVTISTCAGEGFKGFLIQARRADKSKNQAEALGNFSAISNTRQSCPENTSLAHADSGVKSSLAFIWYPPSQPQGHMVFRATFVRDYQTIWADVISDVLVDGSINKADPNTLIAATPLVASCPVGNSTPKPVTEATTKLRERIVKDSACGVTKGCFSCRGSACSFITSWKVMGDYGVYTLTADMPSSSDAYMALGFSSDNRMGDDSVTGCASRNDGSVALFNGQNTGRVAPTLFKDNDVTLVNQSTVDGIFSCTFRRLITASADGKRVDISKPWTLLFATGQASVSTNDDVTLRYHGVANCFVSSAPYKVESTADSGAENLKYPLVKAHGSLMVGAWIFLASVGIVVARYYKKVWTNLLLSQKVWFQIHRICMVLVFSATVIGFIIIFVEVKGWSELPGTEDYLKSHPVIGVIVTALTVLNPIMALFRPHPDTPRRPIFNWAHWLVGMAAHILGVITIFFGVQLDKADAPDYVTYILATYVAWQIFVMLLLEIISCYGHKIDRKEAYELHTGDGDASEVNLPVVESSWSTFVKRILLVAHIIIVGALAVSVIVIIAVE